MTEQKDLDLVSNNFHEIYRKQKERTKFWPSEDLNDLNDATSWRSCDLRNGPKFSGGVGVVYNETRGPN